MTDQHLITPPPELVRKWATWRNAVDEESFWRRIATEAAQWGGDQELEACCEWFQEEYNTEPWVRYDLKRLRNHRRPKPPSLKEQALALLQPGEPRLFNSKMQDTIRHALEALPND